MRIILGCCEQHNLKRAGVPELRAIEAELCRHSNRSHKSCISYIAGVLRAAGTPAVYEEPQDSIVQSANQDHHELREKGLLQLRDLDWPLTSLQKVDSLYRQYREVSDRVGTRMAREVVAKSEGRVRSMAANSRLGPEKRREKREIAQWFEVWLEFPDLFFEWLEMRQKSREFQSMFPRSNGLAWHRPGGRSFSI